MSIAVAPTMAKIDSLQSLRAFAALVVTVSHISKEIMSTLPTAPFQTMLSGVFGVDLFFVISGFIMIFITQGANAREKNPLEFMAKRIVRVVPVYWIYMTAFVVAAIALSGIVNHNDMSLGHILASYAFMPHPRPGDGTIEPVFVLGWTLNYEMYFYLVFAAIMFLPRRMILPALVIYFLTTVGIGFAIPKTIAPIWYWTRSNVLEFLLGVVIAYMFLARVRLPVWAGVLMIVLGLVAWQWIYEIIRLDLRPDMQYAPPPEYRGILYGVPAALIVAGVLLANGISRFVVSGPVGRLFILIGDASFSLYLCHMFVVRIVSLIFTTERLGAFYSPVYFTVALIGCIIASILSYRWLERPIHRWGRQFVDSLFRNRRSVEPA